MFRRLITAAALAVPLLALVLWAPAPLLAAFLAVFVAAGAWEWLRLCGISGTGPGLAYLLLTLALMALLYPLRGQPGGIALAAVGAAWWLTALPLLRRRAATAHRRGPRRYAYAGLGLLALLPAWVALLWLHGLSPRGPYLLLYLLILVWTADSAAYLGGRLWGRRPLAPSISPGKTWEGAFSAAAAVVLLAAAGAAWLGEGRPLAFLLLSLAAFFFSIVGDLLESRLKRGADRKDSGSLLPGHGGVLDRIDSLAAAAPVFASGLWLLRRVT